ncbi:MAG: serine/threonine-protein kinase [Polyangiaceae bacterium]
MAERRKPVEEEVVRRRDPRADDDDAPARPAPRAAPRPRAAIEAVVAKHPARESDTAGDVPLFRKAATPQAAGTLKSVEGPRAKAEPAATVLERKQHHGVDPTMRADDAGATAIAGRAGAAPSTEDDPYGIVGSLQAGCFRVEEVVAEGGFGIIYRALHTRFRAKVALKCLKMPGTLGEEQRALFLQKFNSEAEVLFRLSSSLPEVVRPIHFGELELDTKKFVPFIALEWLEGESLKTIIEKRAAEGKQPMPMARAVKLLEPVARALSRAHRFPGPEGPLAIVHCDIKPDNLFVVHEAEGDIFKILDFGIAKVRHLATRQAGAMTAGDLRMFTPAYAAPEQWDPDTYGQTGPWTDVHALALTLLELATQKPVYSGEVPRILEMAIDTKRRPTPSRLGLKLPAAVDRAFESALAVDPRDRTASVDRFFTDLTQALASKSSATHEAVPKKRPTVATDPNPPVYDRKRSFFNFEAIAEKAGPLPDDDIEVVFDAEPVSARRPPAATKNEAPVATKNEAPAPVEPPRPEPAPTPAATTTAAPVEVHPRTPTLVRAVLAGGLLLVVVGVALRLFGRPLFVEVVGALLLLVGAALYLKNRRA